MASQLFRLRSTPMPIHQKSSRSRHGSRMRILASRRMRGHDLGSERGERIAQQVHGPAQQRGRLGPRTDPPPGRQCRAGRAPCWCPHGPRCPRRTPRRWPHAASRIASRKRPFASAHSARTSEARICRRGRLRASYTLRLPVRTNSRNRVAGRAGPLGGQGRLAVGNQPVPAFGGAGPAMDPGPPGADTGGYRCGGRGGRGTGQRGRFRKSWGRQYSLSWGRMAVWIRSFAQ